MKNELIHTMPNKGRPNCRLQKAKELIIPPNLSSSSLLCDWLKVPFWDGPSHDHYAVCFLPAAESWKAKSRRRNRSTLFK